MLVVIVYPPTFAASRPHAGQQRLFGEGRELRNVLRSVLSEVQRNRLGFRALALGARQVVPVPGALGFELHCTNIWRRRAALGWLIGDKPAGFAAPKLLQSRRAGGHGPAVNRCR